MTVYRLVLKNGVVIPHFNADNWNGCRTGGTNWLWWKELEVVEAIKLRLKA